MSGDSDAFWVWLTMYPWRRTQQLATLFQLLESFQPYTTFWHALNILHMENKLLEYAEDRIPKDTAGYSEVFDEKCLEYAVLLGKSYEAINKKPYEEPAIAELKALDGRRVGGAVSAQSFAESREEILTSMEQLKDFGHSISRAAEITHKDRKLGASKDANRQIWKRHKSKLGQC